MFSLRLDVFLFGVNAKWRRCVTIDFTPSQTLVADGQFERREAEGARAHELRLIQLSFTLILSVFFCCCFVRIYIECCFFFVLLRYINQLVVCRSPGPSQRHHVFLRDGGTRGGRPSRQWVLMCSPPGNVWRTALDITYDGWWPFAEGVMRWFFFAPRALSQGNEEE